jgi:hypothetical protein
MEVDHWTACRSDLHDNKLLGSLWREKNVVERNTDRMVSAGNDTPRSSHNLR